MMVRPIVPKTGMERVYLKTRSQTQNERRAIRDRSTRMREAVLCRWAKWVPKASEPSWTADGSNLPRVLALMMRRIATTIVASHMMMDIQKNGFLHDMYGMLYTIECIKQLFEGSCMICNRNERGLARRVAE
jgi:hypothetical protein